MIDDEQATVLVLEDGLVESADVGVIKEDHAGIIVPAYSVRILVVYLLLLSLVLCLFIYKHTCTDKQTHILCSQYVIILHNLFIGHRKGEMYNIFILAECLVGGQH